MMNVPPPFWIAWIGNRRKFPNPTALPAIAKIIPTLDPQFSFCALF